MEHTNNQNKVEDFLFYSILGTSLFIVGGLILVTFVSLVILSVLSPLGLRALCAIGG